MLKVGWWGYGNGGGCRNGRTYCAGARMWPQLIGCALAQEPGVSLILE